MKLDPYQDFGAHWLANHAKPVLYLADQMRVGKTPQIAAACERCGAKRVLVVCPAIARPGWLRDFREFTFDDYAERSVIVYSAADADKITATTKLVIVSYDLVNRPDVFAALYAHGMVYGYDVLAIDEADALKETDSARTKNVLGRKCTRDGGLAGLAKRVWFVSGTPMPNDPSELFPFARAAGLTSLSKQDWINRYCIGWHDGWEFKITGGKNLAELRTLLAPVTLRRLRSEISKAEVHIGSITIEPRDISAAQPSLKLLAEVEPHLSQTIRDALARDNLDRIPIKHVATLRRVIGMCKVAGMLEIATRALEEDHSRKIVIFGIHRLPLMLLRASLRPYKPILIYGGQPAKKRDNLIEAFRTNHNRRVAIANIGAAATAIDLSAADLLYIFEPSWTPRDNAQAISRIINVREPRLKEAVFVGLGGSIDDAVTRVYERKARAIETLYSAV